MSPINDSDLQSIKALTFDVFGTCVDWRTSVISSLITAAKSKINSPSFPLLPLSTQQTLTSLTPSSWATFAQEWRSSYGEFTSGFIPGKTEWKDIDTHHRDSLLLLLDKWNLPGVYTPEEVDHLSKTWHFLQPWGDSSRGLHALREKFAVATLSNGNQSLLADLNEFGNLGFQRLISAEYFKAYKPNPATYLRACRLLGFEPRRVAMVAAHLGDLEAARRCGLRTIYVERRGEEDWEVDEEGHRGAREWVDLWVSEGEGGFMEVARRLGL